MDPKRLTQAVAEYILSGDGVEAGKEPPLFSIMVPVYNHAEFLPATLDSLLAQTFPHWEAVVVNDGSTDKTPEVMAEYARKDARIRCFHKENGGVATALNLALRQCRGHWVGWLSSDDLYEPNKLELHVAAAKEQPSARFFHTHFRLLHHEEGRYEDHILAHCPPAPPAFQTLFFFKWNYVNGISVMATRELYEQAGNFVGTLRNSQDFNMWVRMSLLTPLNFLNARTVITRVHKASGTSQFPAAPLYDSLRTLVSLLNERSFEELFPFLELADPASTVPLVDNFVQVALSQDAFMYQGAGFITPLAQKFALWVQDRATPMVRDHCRRRMQEILHAIATLQMPPSIRQGLELIAGMRPVAPLEKISALSLVQAHIQELDTSGQHVQAIPLRAYLDRGRTTNSFVEQYESLGLSRN